MARTGVGVGDMTGFGCGDFLNGFWHVVFYYEKLMCLWHAVIYTIFDMVWVK